jgi:hypothetical protein
VDLSQLAGSSESRNERYKKYMEFLDSLATAVFSTGLYSMQSVTLLLIYFKIGFTK